MKSLIFFLAINLHLLIIYDSFPEELVWDDIKANNPVDQVEMFNSCFASIASSSSSGEHDSAKFIFDGFKELKLNNCFLTPGFSFYEFSIDEIKEALNELPASSSPGYIGIHPKIPKGLPELFAPLLLFLFNECLRLKSIPDDWKLAIVNPLFKNKGIKSDINNYRAISVLSPIAKLFEKLLASQISSYCESNNIFFNGQHGFRPGHSCQTAFHEYLSKLNLAKEKKLTTLSLFIDLRKAFDVIDQNILLLKLFHYGFDNNSLGLLSNYFVNRSQIVHLDNERLKPTALKLGVPQGSVLGPLLFLIFINDFPYLLRKF